MGAIRRRKKKNGEVRWSAVVRVDGHPTQSQTFKRKSDASKWIRETERELESLNEAAGHQTVGDAIDAYLETRHANLQPLVQRQRGFQLKWWRDRLGDVPLAKLTASQIARERNSLRVSDATKNRYQAAISRCLDVVCKELFWIQVNPARQVRRLTEARGRTRFLSESERETLLEAARKSPDPRLYPLLVLALSTGARKSELMALRWSDIDFERGVAMIWKSKNSDARPLHLIDEAIEVLLVFRSLTPAPGVKLFPGRFPDHYWQVARKDAGLEDFRWHDLRHSFASYLAMNGASLIELAAALGHRTLAMVQRYSHLTERHEAEIVRRTDFLGTRAERRAID